MKEHLAIFDMDGTLFDTSGVNFRAYAAALQPFGYTLSEEYFATRCNGRYYLDFLPELMGERATKEAMQTVHDEKKRQYAGFLSCATENTALFDLIEAMRARYHIALVTTASRDNCMDLLRAFHREQTFDLILTQQEVTRKKPDPQGFCLAMERFSVPPARTIVFEDAPEGIEAAQRCGAAVLRVQMGAARLF